MPITYNVFDQDLSESLYSWVNRLDSYLLAIGPIGLQDIALSRRLDMSTIRYELSLQYTTPGPAQFRAAQFTERTDADLDAAAAAFFATNPSARIHWIQDISQEKRRSTVQNAVLVIYVGSVMPNCGSDRSRPIIVQALAPILAGASGPAQIRGASGLVAGATLTVVNRSDFTWPTTGRGYAAARIGTCLWDGYALCCDRP